MQSAQVFTKRQSSLETQLSEIFEYLRKKSPENIDHWEGGGKANFQKRLSYFTKKDKPLEFLLPAFPGKSQNKETKVLSHHADLAEEVAMHTIENFVEHIEKIYGKGGARFRILSDGYVFGPAANISDENIARYERECKAFLHNKNILWQDLGFFFPKGSIEEKRAQLDKLYAPSESELDTLIRTDPETNKLYCGMKHFMEEDLTPSQHEHLSGKQKKKRAKHTAREVMRLNIAYTRLHQEHLGHCIRLSIHPCANYDEKFSINLIPGDDTWATPWQRSPAIQKDGQVILLKRSEAESKGYRLEEKNGRPYTFKEV